MKITPFLTALICTLSLLCTTSVVRAAEGEGKEKKAPCCEATVEAGKKCAHDCCVKAADAGKVCEKCHKKS